MGELTDAAAARGAELSRLQAALDEAELAQASEMQDKERVQDALEAVNRQSEEENELKTCCVCLEADRQILFLPCRHVCCCRNCASSLRQCPMDRMTITQQIDFIMA